MEFKSKSDFELKSKQNLKSKQFEREVNACVKCLNSSLTDFQLFNRRNSINKH
jgi:hypothetical protein